MSQDPETSEAPFAPDGPPLAGRAVTQQQWLDATFLHWPVDPDRVAPLLPAGTRPDLLDGSAWVGLISFRMTGLGTGRGRRAPWVGEFLETNVRTYTVDDAGRRGVFFLTLECDRLAAVIGARALLGLNYRWSAQSLRRANTGQEHLVTWTSRGRPRPWTPQSPSRRTGFTVLVDPTPVTPSATDLFLTARFGLHHSIRNRTVWMPNTHDAWPLQRGRLLDSRDELVAWCGLPGVTDDPPQSVLYSPGVRTTFGAPQRVWEWNDAPAQKPRIHAAYRCTASAVFRP